MQQRRRWVAVLVLLAGAWVATPSPVPLYDGVGFPDEPYRYVPARDDNLPAATAAQVQLPVEGGINTRGLIANSAERGPQVTVYAPPQAFQVARPDSVAPLRVRAEPVPPTEPPRGDLVSNVYAVTLTSADGPVSVRPEAQPPVITLRAVSEQPPAPVMHHRTRPGEPWRTLPTKRVGRHHFHADVPGEGEFVLARAWTRAGDSTGTGPLVAAGVLALVVLTAAVLGLRVAGRRRAAS